MPRSLAMSLRFGLLACLALAACGSSPRQTVRAIKDATVPAGDTADTLVDPVTERQSMRFGWEFDSHLDAARYLDWVLGQLTNIGFAINQRGPNAIALTRLEGGDAYRMRIEVVRQSPTHVRVTLTISPD
jgi:hypothetical protein